MYAIRSYYGFNSSFAFADLDKDNDLDLFVGEINGTITFYKNVGYNNFSNFGKLKADGVEITTYRNNFV